MKKIITIILTITMLLLPLNSATVSAIIPGEDAYQSDDLKIYEYEIATGNVDITTLGELRSTVEPSLLASAAPNGVAVSQGFTPLHLQNEPPEIGPDGFYGSWFIISNPDTERYRRTVRLTIRYPNGAQTGTGFMIGPSTVATAGHLVYSPQLGGYPTSITATPAYNAGAAPYGTANGTHIVCNDGWTVERDYEYDWGVILLNSNIGDSTGWLSVRYQAASYNNTTVDVLGYPGADEYGDSVNKLYRSSGKITQSNVRQLLSNNTNSADGSSGGPVQVYYANTGYTAIALVSGDGPQIQANVFARITEEVYDFFLSYRNRRV